MDSTYEDAFLYRAAAYYSIGKNRDALNDFSTVTDINPKNKEGWLNRACCHEGLQEHTEAMDTYQKIINEIDNKYELAHIYKGLGHFKKREYEDAILCFSDVINDIIPLSEQALEYRGSSYFIISEYKKSIADFSKILNSINPKSSAAYNNLGLALSKLKKYKSSIRCYNTIINNLNPKFTDAYLNRATSYAKISKYQEALLDLSHYINNYGTQMELAYMNRGSCNQILQCHTKAISDFSTIINEINHKSSDAYLGLAVSYCAHQQFNIAKQAVKNALILGSTKSNFYRSLSNYYYKMYGESNIEIIIISLKLAETYAKDKTEFPSLYFRIGSFYSIWKEQKTWNEKFLYLTRGYEEYSEWVSEEAFYRKEDIARQYYANSFLNWFDDMRTDVEKYGDEVSEFQLDKNLLSIISDDVHDKSTEKIANETEAYLFVPASRHLLDTLENKRFLFTNVSNFAENDCPLLRTADYPTSLPQVTFDFVRIRCLSTEMNSAMWQNFGDYSSGICYKLKIKRRWLLKNSVYAKKVRYSHDEHNAKEFILNCDSPEQVIESGLCVKPYSKNYENELRLIIFNDFASHGNKGEYLGFNQGNDGGVSILAIYLGARFNGNKNDIIQIAKPEGIEIFQTMYDNKKGYHYKPLS